MSNTPSDNTPDTEAVYSDSESNSMCVSDEARERIKALLQGASPEAVSFVKSELPYCFVPSSRTQMSCANWLSFSATPHWICCMYGIAPPHTWSTTARDAFQGVFGVRTFDLHFGALPTCCCECGEILRAGTATRACRPCLAVAAITLSRFFFTRHINSSVSDTLVQWLAPSQLPFFGWRRHVESCRCVKCDLCEFNPFTVGDSFGVVADHKQESDSDEWSSDEACPTDVPRGS